MLDLTQPIDTGHRAGRMLKGLLASSNRGAKLLLTTDLIGADGETRLHRTFAIKRWEGRDGVMLSVEIHGSGDYAAGTRAIKMFHISPGHARLVEARDARGDNKLLRYAAEAAVKYAWHGTLPTPPNGSVTVTESDTCSMCGRTLTDPVSIERGIGPECFGKATDAKVIPLPGQAVLA